MSLANLEPKVLFKGLNAYGGARALAWALKWCVCRDAYQWKGEPRIEICVPHDFYVEMLRVKTRDDAASVYLPGDTSQIVFFGCVSIRPIKVPFEMREGLMRTAFKTSVHSYGVETTI